MKKLITIVSIMIISIALFWGLSFYAFRDYPTAIVATSRTADANNRFLLNGTVTGDNNGFCTIIRDEEYTEITLINNSQEESVIITNKLRFTIEDARGDDLGLQIIQANNDQDLRNAFGCEW